jgi:hypothetical protein
MTVYQRTEKVLDYNRGPISGSKASPLNSKGAVENEKQTEISSFT